MKTKTDRMIDLVRYYHAIGLQANDFDYSGRDKTAQFAKNSGMNVDTVRKARAFAKHYTSKDLDAFCELRRSRDLRPQPLHWGYVVYLLLVPTKKLRAQLAKRAAAEDWSPTKLYEVVKKCRTADSYGNHRRLGGRPPKYLQDPDNFVLELLEQSRYLKRNLDRLANTYADLKKIRLEKRIRDISTSIAGAERKLKRIPLSG